MADQPVRTAEAPSPGYGLAAAERRLIEKALIMAHGITSGRKGAAIAHVAALSLHEDA